MNEIKIKKLHPYAIIPTRSHQHDAGMDIYASETVILEPQEKHLLHTGIAIDITPGYVGLLTSRSGVSSKTNLVIETGKIDSGYNGEMKINIKNDMQYPSKRPPLFHKVMNVKGGYIYSEREVRGDGSYLIQKGDKIAQLVISPIVTPSIEVVEEFESESARGTNGFGSTGH